jgi:nucleotide-binding universal stress UspA family protein
MFSNGDLQLDRNEVVVGLDDSPAACAALRWAARYARYTFTDLRAVHVLPAWVDASWAWTVGTAALAGPALTDWMDDSIAGTTHLFEAVDPELDWSLEHVVGTPGPVLVAAAAHAQLLIVGTRHRTGIGRLLSGSVSQYCLHSASCPVVAIPDLQASTSTPSNPPQRQRNIANARVRGRRRIDNDP